MTPRLFIHNTFFRIGSAPVFGVMVYLLLILINNTVEDVNELFNNQELYVCIVLSYIAFESMRLVIRLVDKKIATDVSIQSRIIYQIVLTLIISLTLIGVSISFYFNYVIGFSIGRAELNLFLLIYGAGGLLYNILYFSQTFLFRENKQKIEQEKALHKNLEAEFASFRNDVNPDLLYESLESLILLIHRNTDQADEFIDYLAGIYRYSLMNRNKELVNFTEEFRATNYLMGILDFKYPDQVQLQSEVKDQDIYLIPGSVLVSIDHIVRNTLISKDVPLEIKLYIEDDYLVMYHLVNDKLLLHEDSTQAFQRLQRSYSFFSEKPFVQVKVNRENYIKFPLVRVASEQPIDVTV